MLTYGLKPHTWKFYKDAKVSFYKEASVVQITHIV